MSLKLRCPCGKRLGVSEELAGGRTRCPACDRILAVDEHRETEVPKPASSRDIWDDDELPEECVFCGRRKVRMIPVWTAVTGPKVPINTYGGEGPKNWPTYRELTRHRVPVCLTCIKSLWVRHHGLLLIGGAVALVVAMLFLGLGVRDAVRGRTNSKAVAYLIGFFVSFGFGVVSFVNLMIKMVRGKMGVKTVHFVVVKAAWKKVIPRRHDAYMAEYEVDALLPAQIADDPEGRIARSEKPRRRDDDDDDDEE